MEWSSTESISLVGLCTSFKQHLYGLGQSVKTGNMQNRDFAKRLPIELRYIYSPLYEETRYFLIAAAHCYLEGGCSWVFWRKTNAVNINAVVE
jgi:hypothetical protein